VGTALTLYLNFFVLVVQLFQKVPALLVSAPTQKEPPFVVTQLLVLAMFAVLSVAAFKKFPPQAVKPFQ
jgi:H+/Cl- antiporter ClcA